MYILYYAETMEPVLFTNWGSPRFESLDEVEEYLDAQYDAFDCIDDTIEEIIYEVSTNGEISYIAAILS